MVIIYLINIEEEKENRLCIHTLILTNKQYIVLIQNVYLLISLNSYIIEATRAVTSIKQTPALKYHLFLLLSKMPYELNLFYDVTCLIRSVFLCPEGDDLLIHALTVYM